MSRSRSKSRVRKDQSPDPFEAALLPPKNETREQRLVREQEEERARKISMEIDNSLKAEKAALKRAKKAIKVLILGQSYSGKSTMIKNLQMQYGREDWAQERASWLVVILLNLLRGVNTILDALAEERSPHSRGSMIRSSKLSTSSMQQHQALAVRLLPLRQVQDNLEGRLGAASHEVAENYMESSSNPQPKATSGNPSEFSINSNAGWKRIFGMKSSKSQVDSGDSPVIREALEALVAHRDEIQSLWMDPVVRDALRHSETTIDDTVVYFLNNVNRIAAQSYQPSDDDILRCRLRTTAIQTYHFKIGSQDWNFYDFQGSRSARSAWFSFFDDVNAVIFVAPINVYDEQDSDGVNKLQDSLLLWRTIVSNKLLADAGVQLVLFLNKCDLLAKKLEQGISPVKTHFPKYNKPNDLKNVQGFFRAYFKEILTQYSPIPREYVAHFTSAVDNRTTSATLFTVKELIFRKYLERSALI